MPEMLINVGRLVAIVALAYGILAFAAHLAAPALIFPRPPVKYELTPDYLRLRTPDGVELAARHWPNPRAKYTLLYLHGNYEDLGSIGEYIPRFVDAGYAVFAFDYRRYGWSGGVPSEASTYADTRLAYAYLRDQLGVPPERIIVFGYSLGGGPAVELVRRHPAAGLVLQGAFVSAYRVMTRVPLFPGDKFVNLAKVPELKLPVLVLHGTADTTVPCWHGRALYAAVTAPKQILIVEGGGHTGLSEFAGDAYWDALRRFADSLPENGPGGRPGGDPSPRTE
jgi:pimeloyl-ACP methyl ester carboxylesterase